MPQTEFGQEVTEGSLSTFPMKTDAKIDTEKTFGNKFAYFEFHEPQGAQIIRHRFKVTVWELRWNLDPDKIVQVGQWPESFQPYRRGESQAVVIDAATRQTPDAGRPPARQSTSGHFIGDALGHRGLQVRPRRCLVAGEFPSRSRRNVAAIAATTMVSVLRWDVCSAIPPG